MSRAKEAIPLLLALCIGIVGSLLAYKWIRSYGGTRVPQLAGTTSSVDTVGIAVANTNLSGGMQFTGDLLDSQVTMKPYLAASLPVGCFQDAQALRDRVVLKNVVQGDPIQESDLAPADVTKGGINVLVHPGYRAMTVKGDSEFEQTGFIEPGDVVDVLVTFEGGDADKPAISKVVLENVFVLAVGSRTGPGQGGQEAKSDQVKIDTFTLEVTPKDGEKLALAASKGRLHFALRNALDSNLILTQGATESRTVGSFYESRGTRVEIIKGTDITAKTF